jgi:hypothetical protein
MVVLGVFALFVMFWQHFSFLYAGQCWRGSCLVVWGWGSGGVFEEIDRFRMF